MDKKIKKALGSRPETLILFKEIMNGRMNQIAISAMIMVVLGLQIYLFVSLNQLFRMVLDVS
jgi:hypothetical protein